MQQYKRINEFPQNCMTELKAVRSLLCVPMLSRQSLNALRTNCSPPKFHATAVLAVRLWLNCNQWTCWFGVVVSTPGCLSSMSCGSLGFDSPSCMFFVVRDWTLFNPFCLNMVQTHQIIHWSQVPSKRHGRTPQTQGPIRPSNSVLFKQIRHQTRLSIEAWMDWSNFI